MGHSTRRPMGRALVVLVATLAATTGGAWGDPQVYDFEQLSAGLLAGQDNWDGGLTVYDTPASPGGVTNLGGGNFLATDSGLFVALGDRASDENFTFDLSSLDEFTIGVDTIYNRAERDYGGYGEFGLWDPVLGRRIAFGVKPGNGMQYWQPYITTPDGLEHLADTNDPDFGLTYANGTAYWQAYMEINTIGSGSATAFVRELTWDDANGDDIVDDGEVIEPEWIPVPGLLNVDLGLNAVTWEFALTPDRIRMHMETKVEVWGFDNFWIDDGTSEPPAHPGDANRDGVVDLQDFGFVKDNFALSGMTWEQGDFNGDGSIDLQDFGILKDHFAHTNGDPLAPVPEPATLVVLLIGAGTIARRRKA